MQETLRHQEAFEAYYAAGQDRNLSSIAVQYRVSEKSVANWSKAFRWQERIAQRDVDLAAKLKKETDKLLLADKKKYLLIVEGSLQQYVSALKNGLIKIDSVTDLEKLVKLALLLSGEATERQSMEVCGLGNVNPDELRNRLERAARRITADGVSPVS